MITGFVKIYRSMLDWEWFDDSNTVHLFLYLLLKANHKEKEWRGITIKRGQLLTSTNKLRNATHQSVQQTRTSLERLKIAGTITIYSTSRYSIVTICNYDKYQNDNRKDITQSNKQINIKTTKYLTRESTNKATSKITITKEDKNLRKEEIKNNKTSKASFEIDRDFSEKLKKKIIEFVEYREDIKKPFLSQKSIDLLQSKLKKKKEDEAIQELNQTILNGWKGIFPLNKTQKNSIENRKLYEPQELEESNNDRLKL